MPTSDSYGIDVLLTDAGDLSVTPAGGLALIDGPMNCAQALIMRLKTSPGELPLQPDYGNAIARAIVGTKAGDPTLILSAVNSELRRVFEADPRFLKADRIHALADPADPARSMVTVDLVLAGGDRLTSGDLVDAPELASFTSAPELAESVSPDELAAIAGSDPDAEGDVLPDLDEDLEGVITSTGSA